MLFDLGEMGAASEQKIIKTKGNSNGSKRSIQKKATTSYLMDSLKGILKEDDLDGIKSETMIKKYGV